MIFDLYRETGQYPSKIRWSIASGKLARSRLPVPDLHSISELAIMRQLTSADRLRRFHVCAEEKSHS